MNRIIRKSKLSRFEGYKAENESEDYLKKKEFYSSQMKIFRRDDDDRELRLKMKILALENGVFDDKFKKYEEENSEKKVKILKKTKELGKKFKKAKILQCDFW